MGFWICDKAAYERIVAAVGEKPVNCDHLVSDLLDARQKLLLFTVLDSREGAKARKDLFSGIADDARDLKGRLLANQEYAARGLIPDGPRRLTLLRELDHIIDGAKVSEQQNSGAWLRLQRPVREWFAAEILPDVFKRNFPEVHKRHPGQPIGFSRPSGGPYIKFAVQVMREMGVSIEPNTVARAIQDVRRGAHRRKGRSKNSAAS
jgi:hypothetical protein